MASLKLKKTLHTKIISLVENRDHLLTRGKISDSRARLFNANDTSITKVLLLLYTQSFKILPAIQFGAHHTMDVAFVAGIVIFELLA